MNTFIATLLWCTATGFILAFIDVFFALDFVNIANWKFWAVCIICTALHIRLRIYMGWA